MKGHFKRIFDVVVSVSVLVVLSWLVLLIVILYTVSFQFPVFFKQARIGHNEKIFLLLKFRTLKTTGVSLNDRKFWLGNILRFTSLDEIPQMLNVLKGEMAVIGPRPLPVEYLPLFSQEQRKRHTVKPGITGWAQVNGRHSITWTKKFELDIFYINNRTFGLDMKILFKTLLLLMSFKKDNSLLEQKFTGNTHA